MEMPLRGTPTRRNKPTRQLSINKSHPPFLKDKIPMRSTQTQSSSTFFKVLELIVK